ncbi:MAG: beta-lactamase family protein, partial [Gemmatimonadetes bacterium]|nr:beta-lactamase family protein [Gemmatimonadota bacterium]
GMPADEFIQKRILDPLQMKDSFFNHTRPDNQRRSRVAAAYRGEPGNWDKVFENSDLPLARFLRPSWGLLSTAMDYAKFMSMMLHDGRFGTRQLLSPATVKLATSPHSEYVYDAASLREIWAFYGLFWSVLSDKYRLIPGLQSSGSFGHNGGQGTDAWVDPQQDLIFIYLTQSRGHQTRRRFVELVHAAIVD